MRLLVIPNIGLTELRGDSSWHTAIDFCRHGVGRMFAYILLPKNCINHVPEEMLPPNVKLVFAPYNTPGFYEWEGYLDRWIHQTFSQTIGRYPVDGAYLTSSMGVAPLQRLLSNRERRRAGFPVIIGDLMVFDPNGLSYGTYPSEEAFHGLRALGYAMGHSFVSSHFDAKRLARLCRKWLSPALCRRVEEQCHPFSNGVQCAEIDRIIQGVEKDPRFTLVWSGRVNPATGSDIALSTMQMIYQAGYDTPAIVSTQTAEGTAREYLENNAEVVPPPTWDMTFSTPRTEFLRRIARGHAFLHMGRAFGIGIRLKEHFYVGLIGIVPNRPYMPELVGENYPFLYRSKEQAYSMARYLETHWNDPDIQGRIHEIRQNILTQYDNGVVRGRQLDTVERLVVEARGTVDQSLFGRENANKKLVDDALILLGKPALVGWRDVLQAIDSLEHDYFNEHRAARMTPYEVYRALIFEGYEDTLETADPLFRAPEA